MLHVYKVLKHTLPSLTHVHCTNSAWCDYVSILRPCTTQEEEILHDQLNKEIIKTLCLVYDNHKRFYKYLDFILCWFQGLKQQVKWKWEEPKQCQEVKI